MNGAFHISLDSRYTVLPRRPTRRDDAEWPCYAEAIDSYRQLVFSVRRKSFGNSNRFSELDWLKNAEVQTESLLAVQLSAVRFYGKCWNPVRW